MYKTLCVVMVLAVLTTMAAWAAPPKDIVQDAVMAAPPTAGVALDLLTSTVAPMGKSETLAANLTGTTTTAIDTMTGARVATGNFGIDNVVNSAALAGPCGWTRSGPLTNVEGAGSEKTAWYDADVGRAAMDIEGIGQKMTTRAACAEATRTVAPGTS